MISDFVSAEVYLVLMQWPGVHKRLLAVRETRVCRSTTAQPMMEQRQLCSLYVRFHTCEIRRLGGIRANDQLVIFSLERAGSYGSAYP